MRYPKENPKVWGSQGAGNIVKNIVQNIVINNVKNIVINIVKNIVIKLP